MAQLRSNSTDPRVSHLLPTVKCSNCALPVPLSALGEHVCSPRQQSKSSQQPRLRSDSQSLRLNPDNASVPPRVPASISHVPFPSVATPPPHPRDYMPGGESGMAGVGRRAFQAAAHAAVFAQHHGTHPDADLPQGYTVRRGNPPQFLDISAAGRGTPPLSPNSGYSSPRSYSPHSPLSQSPLTNNSTITASPISPSTSISRTISSSSRSTPRKASTPTPAATSRLPFLQRYKDTLGQTLPTSPGQHSKQSDPFYTPRADTRRPPSPADSDGSSTGLAYDRDEMDDEPVGILGRLSLEEKDSASTSSHSMYSAASKTRMTRDDLVPPVTSPRRSHTTPTAGPRGGPGGLPSPLPPSSPPPVPAARSVSDAKNMRRDKSAKSTRQRVCIRCERTIDDGRWVRTDTNKGVLCERCWKNMYLPKCRRCDQPIEKAAVFSSDGQLKGKYHRACFTCHVCRRPFPDKSFYVYDGHPLCAFHYHEANRSLCAARTCGRPIEGPCAVTEAGDRFHPDCLRCEHAGCGERLEDYWEVGGMVLCERHAQRQEDEDEDAEEASDQLGALGRITSARRPPRLGSSEARAQKRTTRLINLSGGGAF